MTPAECARIAGLYDQPGHFRATIDMARHRFGEGQYRYFTAPFPEPVDALRHGLYGRLLPVARDWYERLGRRPEWPDTLDEWLDVCHTAGQKRRPKGESRSNQSSTGLCPTRPSTTGLRPSARR